MTGGGTGGGDVGALVGVAILVVSTRRLVGNGPPTGTVSMFALATARIAEAIRSMDLQCIVPIRKDQVAWFRLGSVSAIVDLRLLLGRQRPTP